VFESVISYGVREFLNFKKYITRGVFVIKLRLHIYLVLPLLVSLISPIFPAAAQVSQGQEKATSEAAPTFSPRFGVRYTTEGAGFRPYTSFEGFLPVLQDPGKSMTFLQGGVSLDNNSGSSASILLGHRLYSNTDKNVVGGYVSFNSRDTGKSNFNQLGLGIESLGNWDFRANAYLPLNNGEKQVGSDIFDGNNAFFQGSNLLVPRTRQYEVALSGVDAEVGTKLASLGSGDLRGYAGAYYYDGGQSREAFGWKTRLEARPTDYLGMSVSLQHDALFETRAVFSIGLSFPGSGAQGSKLSRGSALARMGENVDRQNVIPVANETRNDTVFATGTNGNPLNFKTPLGTAAFSLVGAAPNDVITVNDNVTPLAGFTVPTGVQVISTGPVQFLDTSIGKVKIPNTGTGNYPVVNGTVTLASNTTLSGFDIKSGANNPGVIGSNISNVTVRDNKISGLVAGAQVGAQGINLQNLSGINTIENNTITGFRKEAINLAEATGTIAIKNNNINNNGIAADNAINLINSKGTVALGVTNNNISNNNGVAVNLFGTAQGTANLENNTIDKATTGVKLVVDDQASLAAILKGNTISASSTNGVEAQAINSGKLRLSLTSNTISGSAKEAVTVSAFNSSDVSVIAESNTLTNNNNSSAGFSAFDVAADPNSSTQAPKVCVRLNKNTGTSNTIADYSLFNGNLGGATFQVENTLATNTGNIKLQAYNGTSLIPGTATSTAIGSQAITAGFTSAASGSCPAP
jgi:trimeric autotransporter adhesin